MLVTLLLLACAPESVEKPPTAAATGEGLFLHGCPEAGRAAARTLTDLAETPWGPDALAAPGDVLLVNERAAFVIQAPDDPRTYYHYGGTPIDAVAVDGCAQAGPELLGEMGFILGQLDLADFGSSSLHMVRGDTVTVVNDGADGAPAVVEVNATDDRFWLVELTLMRGVYEDGGRKPLGDLFGLDLTLRYTLAPDDPTLQIDVLVDGEPAGAGVEDGFLVGSVLFPSDYTEEHAWSSGDLSVGGIGLDVGVPWVEDTSADGSTALAMPGATLAKTTISGVTVLLDLNQAAVPLQLGEEARFALAVSPSDGASAAAGLEAHLDDPVPGHTTRWADLSGTVQDTAGVPIAGATVEVRAEDDGGSWPVLTTLRTDADGRFAGRTLAVGDTWRFGATGAGRDDGELVDVPVDAASDLALDVGRSGELTVDVVDDSGRAMATRVELQRTDGVVVHGYPSPQDPSFAVPPGTWTAYVTRGYEYEPVTTTVTIPEDGAGRIDATLSHVVDTSGWASFDSHVHAGPSPDADELPADRMRTAAASGLDLVISTDHEAIVDLADAVTEAGLDGELAYGLGSEVTASLPEHTNAWPFPVADGPRGEPVRWYGLGFPGIYAAERARGARVIQLNHARVNNECGILCILDWDRVSDPPMTADPEALGLSPGDAIWSWDFDSFEVLNSLRSPYYTSDERRSGALYDWLAFHNLGYRVTPTGVTDVHGDGTPGTPRTYAAVADDSVDVVTADIVADAVLAGAAQVSAGAFARVTIDGAGPGETVSVTSGEATLALHVEAIPEIDVTRVEVLVDCDAYASLDADDPDAVVKLDTTLALPVDRDLYVVVLVIGEGAMPRGIEGYDANAVPRSIVAPIFVDGDGDGVWTPPGPKSCDWRP